MQNSILETVIADQGDAVNRELAGGVTPNSRDAKSGLTAVMLAAGHGKPEILQALLIAGGDIHATDSKAGATALHKACQGGSLECVRILVEAGAFVDAQCATTGHTALFEAIWFKQTEIVRYLLDHGSGLCIRTHYGFTLDEHLAYAESVNQSVPTELEKVRAARRAVEERRKHDAALDRSQQVMAATVAGDSARVRELLRSGATPDERYPVVNGFNDAHTPLLVASRDGHIEIVIALLAVGADVNATEPTFGAVPLHKAVYNGHCDIAKVLIAAKGIDLNFQGATNGYTPLLDSIWHGFKDCAFLLINAGARLDLAGHDGKTPLRLAEEVFGTQHEVSQAIRTRLQ
jgi:uncharacterized protein